MTRPERGMVRVYEVRHVVRDDDPGAHGGAAGDGSYIARFRSARDAKAFARGREGYGGNPATADARDVPRYLAERWGLA